MRALALNGIGGLEQLSLVEIPRPEIAGSEDVLIRIHAAGLNRLDLFVAAGLPGVDYSFPHVVGSDGAGADCREPGQAPRAQVHRRTRFESAGCSRCSERSRSPITYDNPGKTLHSGPV